MSKVETDPGGRRPAQQKRDARPETAVEGGRKPSAGDDPTRTPGDGTLQGATPAGLTVEELRKRADAPDETNQTGTG